MVEDYLKYKIKADGSETTMRSPLVAFADHCKDKRGVDRVDELTDQDFRNYSESLYDRSKIDEELAASTAQTYFAYVRAFISWCVREQHLKTNPANTNTAMDPLPQDDGKRKTQYWSKDDQKGHNAPIRAKGYSQRWMAETSYSTTKRSLSDAVRARGWYRPFREIVLMFAIVNIEPLCELL